MSGRFRGTLSQHGQVVLPDISGLLDKNVGQNSWEGSFTLPAHRPSLLTGGEYELTLDDGRRARLFISGRICGRQGKVIVLFRVRGDFWGTR